MCCNPLRVKVEVTMTEPQVLEPLFAKFHNASGRLEFNMQKDKWKGVPEPFPYLCLSPCFCREFF